MHLQSLMKNGAGGALQYLFLWSPKKKVGKNESKSGLLEKTEIDKEMYCFFSNSDFFPRMMLLPDTISQCRVTRTRWATPRAI
jgi:hypothetical protein